MSSQVTVPPEFFATVRAVVWFDVCVSEEMGLEVGSLVETTATSMTLVRRIFHVKYLVDLKCPGLTEPFSTVRTLEGLLFRVNVSVVSQVVLSSECLVTNVTGVWSLIRMSTFMNQ